MAVKDRDAIGWLYVLRECGVRPQTAARWAPVCADQLVAASFSRGWDEIDDFLAQVLHESQYLERVEENLNYRTAERIVATWPRRFPNEDAAAVYVGAPERLAEKVYGNRLDLGNIHPGDGWKYRGRAPIMSTGRANYELLAKAIGEPLIERPDILASPRVGMKASIAWWEKRVPDSAIGNPGLVSRIVNGGDTGLKERIALSRTTHHLLS